MPRVHSPAPEGRLCLRFFCPQRRCSEQRRLQSAGAHQAAVLHNAGVLLAPFSTLPPPRGLPASGTASLWRSKRAFVQWANAARHNAAREQRLPAKGGKPCLLRLVLDWEHEAHKQAAAWTNQFAFLAVAPVPGTMIMFPGYLPHAVLPRAPPPAASDAEVGSDAMQSLRVTVACNVHAQRLIQHEPAPQGGSLPSVWLASRMA